MQLTLYLFTFKTELNGCGNVLYTIFWHHVWNTRIYKHQTKTKLPFYDVILEISLESSAS